MVGNKTTISSGNKCFNGEFCLQHELTFEVEFILENKPTLHFCKFDGLYADSKKAKKACLAMLAFTLENN